MIKLEKVRGSQRKFEKEKLREGQRKSEKVGESVGKCDKRLEKV